MFWPLILVSCQQSDTYCKCNQNLLRRIGASNEQLVIEIHANISDKKESVKISSNTNRDLANVQENIRKVMSYRRIFLKKAINSENVYWENEDALGYIDSLNTILKEDFVDSASFDHFKFRYETNQTDRCQAIIMSLLFEKEYMRIQEKMVYELILNDIPD